MRKLTKQTIKPVIRFIGGWDNTIYSMNTNGSKYYSFTLDTYNGKNAFRGGFDWQLEDALRHEMYALEFETGNIYDQNKNIVMNAKDINLK